MLSYEKVVSSVAPVGPMEMGTRCCDLEDCLEKKHHVYLREGMLVFCC